MTVEEKIRKMLIQNGLSDDQTDEVIKLLKESDLTKSMANRWSDSIDSYPSMIITVLWISAKKIALEYIDETFPQAWFRPMFE